MSLEEIIERILSSRRDLTRDKIFEMIEEKKGTAEGYFTDEVAARIVASELGVEVPWWKPFRAEILIQDLISGLNDATLIGRVITIYPVKTFTRQAGTEGKLIRLLIADKTGTLPVVLWDDKTSLAEPSKMKRGQIIKVSHGYVREGLDGRLELHVGARGEVQASPSGVVDSEYPPVTQFMQKIKEITTKYKEVSVLGVVQSVHPISEFKRSDGTSGKVRRLQLRDETGQITVVFWNEKVDQLGEVKKGDYLQLLNTKVKEQPYGRIELHAENRAQIETLIEVPPYFEPPSALPTHTAKVKELNANMYDVDVLARVVHAGEVREFERPSGEKGRVSTLLIRDETGTISLNLWGEKAPLSERIHSGDIVLAEAAYTRERFGRVNLNIGKRGTLSLDPDLTEAKKLPPHEEVKTKIAEVKEGGPLTVRGSVAQTPMIREVVTSRNAKVKVASFELTDDTGKIRVSAWRRLADFVKDLPAGTQIEIKNVYSKKGFGDQMELTTRTFTSIEILSKP